LQDEADCRLGETVGGAPVDGNSAECQRLYTLVDRYAQPGSPIDEQIISVVTVPINRALQEQTGIDAAVSYSLVTDRAGLFNFQASYTHVLHSKIQEFPDDPIQTDWRDDPQNFEFRHRFRGSVSWAKGDWGTTLFGTNVGSIPNWAETDRLDPLWTFNMSITWDVTDSIRLSAIGNNITNAKPRLDDTWPSWPGFSRFNYNPVGREVWAQIDWTFGRK